MNGPDVDLADDGLEAPKVLVVDDDLLTQRVLQLYLHRAGYRMLGASDGKTAIKLARSESPQLIILDVIMPQIDGWTVLRRLRRAKITQRIPVILLSGDADLMSREESLNCGADQLLVKPISPDQLLAVVRRFVRCGKPQSAAAA
jgi:DNA-binding response OmpR family regulator